MSGPPYLLCASDLDGTLLDSQSCMTDFTKDTIYRLQKERGLSFVLATGRHHLSVRAVRESLTRYLAERRGEAQGEVQGEGAPGLYLLSSNGARIHDGNGKLLFERNLDPDVVRGLYREFGLPYTKKRYVGPPGTVSPALPATPVTWDEATKAYVSVRDGVSGELPSANEGEDAIHGSDEEPEDVVSTSAYTTDAWFLTASFMPDSKMLQKFGFLPNCVPFDVHEKANDGKSVFDAFPVEGVGKVCFRCSDTSMLAYFEKAIHARFPGRVSVALSSNYCLDVMAAGVSKASALEALAVMLHSGNSQGESAAASSRITMSRIIAFGDSMNDMDMLQAVGKGCLMQNAQPRLKEALPQCEVIGHHDDNAVAKKLREIFAL